MSTDASEATRPAPSAKEDTPKADSPKALGAAQWTGLKTIIIREYGRIIRIWAQTIVPSAVTSALYFVIFGSLIGKRVGLMDGVPYMQYIAPGLIMMAVITNSYGNVVSSFFGAKFGKHVEEMLVAPLSNWIIVALILKISDAARRPIDVTGPPAPVETTPTIDQSQKEVPAP
jgi:ABC-type multidrug transport system permease subunit